MDSGSQYTISGNSSSGITATKNIDDQPKCGSMKIPTLAASMPPRE